MDRVLVECDRAAAGFDADAVHDLRVALRRCRSLADGMIAIDPDPSWKAMKKAGKKLFQALGELRDVQVMEEWIEKLAGASGDDAIRSVPKSGDAGIAASRSAEEKEFDPVAERMLAYLRIREEECKQSARKDLQQFDRRVWRSWARSLPQRAARVRPGSSVYQHLALERWTEAYDLHKRALRAGSMTSWHSLRIGIKRLRYTVENFLPREQAEWGFDLKEVQDWLGEVHDLDVLWAAAVRIQAFPDVANRERWRAQLDRERKKRIERYRLKMVGRESRWRVWRAELPSGLALHGAALHRLRTWAGYLDPDISHSHRVARLALQVFDGLQRAGLLKVAAGQNGAGVFASLDARAVLQAAALMHDVGKAAGSVKHEKKSYRMIRGMARPLGWGARELALAAVVARYHRGALPHLRSKAMQALDFTDRALAMELSGVLRLANALDGQGGRDEGPRRVEVGVQDGCVVVALTGYSAIDRAAEQVAAARHLLETVLRRPVLMRGLKAMPVRPSTRVRGVR
jgi:exopolyphosphatase/guanosine-5'-triphosphate,3'-diphosphate pyrophosphatase